MLVTSTFALTSCEKDIDSNPVLIENSEPQQTIVLNTPEFANSDIALAGTESLALSWSQPSYTDNKAPLGSSGNLGLSYAIQVSKDGNFTRTFETAKKEVTLEDGTFSGKPTGQNYVNLPTTYAKCSASVSAEELNTALNQLNVWDEGDVLGATEAYIRVAALLAKSDGKLAEMVITTNAEGKKDTTIVFPKDTLAYSNVQKVKLIPSEWENVMVVPAKVSYLWIPGEGNGWNHDFAPILVSNDGNVYKGYAYMKGKFKFTPVGEWNKGEYNNSHFEGSDIIDVGSKDGGDIKFTGAAGLYNVTVDLTAKTIDAQPVTWSVIGAFNDWAGDEDMTYDEENHCLSVSVNFASDTKWKFRCNHDWGVNLGGDLKDLTQDGSDIEATAGAHTIQLFIERPAQDGMKAVIK